MKKIVGILGATGSTGVGAVKMLKQCDEIKLVLGGRSLEKLKKSYSDNKNMTLIEVDIFNEKSLKSFIDKCEAVINCAGPSSKIEDKVAKICIDKNIIYVDVSGNKSMYKKICEYQSLKKQGKCVLSAGTYPGLTEIYMDYICKKHYDRTIEVKEYFSGNSKLSITGAYDIIDSLEKSEGHGMVFYDNGTLNKINEGFGMKKVLPEPVGSVNVMPLISNEFFQTAKINNISNAYFYNTFSDLNLLMQFIQIKALEQFKTEEEKLKSANNVINMFCNKSNQEYFLMYIESKGVKEGKEDLHKDVLICSRNWNEITGLIAAITVLQVIKKLHLKEGKVYFAGSVLDSKEVIEDYICKQEECYEQRYC